MVAPTKPYSLPLSDVFTSLRSWANDVAFTTSSTFRWSPANKTVYYVEASLSDNSGIWALIHETAHAVLDHASYQTDFGLLKMEVAAWEKAKDIASDVGITIDNEHIEDCLDTYRDWLHRRSTCPTCGTVSLQQSTHEYRCHNCQATWAVSAERFCRPYRQTKKLLAI